MNIIEAYIKHFDQLVILLIGLPTSSKSEIAKELFTDIKPTFTLININDYMNGFIEKEVNGIKFKLYDYPDNINWNKLIQDIENKKSTGVILYGNYIDYNKIKDKITIDFSYFFDLKHSILKKNLIEKKMLPFEVSNNKNSFNSIKNTDINSSSETVSVTENSISISNSNIVLKNSDVKSNSDEKSDSIVNSVSNKIDEKSEEINNKLEIYIKDILLPIYKNIKENIKFNKFYNIKETTTFEEVYDDLFDNLMLLIQNKLKKITN
jgi:hypothetical protein